MKALLQLIYANKNIVGVTENSMHIFVSSKKSFKKRIINSG
jgi:hypothetical protein